MPPKPPSSPLLLNSVLARSLADFETSLRPLANNASVTDDQLRAVLHKRKDIKQRIEDIGLYVDEVKEVAYYVIEMLGKGE